MKATIAAALAGTLAAAAAFAQQASPPGGPPLAGPRNVVAPKPGGRAQPASNPPTGARDSKVFPASATLPAPVPPDQIKPATIVLPQDPIEPYLLTKDVGPFLVTARSFVGPEAEKFALVLAKELRQEYRLPAWILRTRDFPMRSNIRNIPPTAPRGVPRSEVALPEKVRTHDEAIVLVGNEKTLADQEKLWHQVKKLHPQCLNDMPSLFSWRNGLSSALRTTNPFIPAQDLFPGRRDELVYQMNQGPHSIYQCTGRYTLEVAQYVGRSTFRVDEAKAMGLDILKRSPLAEAADKAEHLANALAKAPEFQKMGQPVYVYHDRQASRVLVGAFSAPSDPNAVQLRDYLVKNAYQMMDLKDSKSGKTIRSRGIDTMLAPAMALTDLDNPDSPIRPQRR